MSSTNLNYERFASPYPEKNCLFWFNKGKDWTGFGEVI